MTEGNIWERIIKFALPLALGYIFQQFYTTVDSIVVGNFVSKQALAAVGTTTPIINMLIGFFTGLSSGASVVIARNYGAQNKEKVQDAVHTAIGMIFTLSIFATAIGVFMVPYMLKLMKTPDDVFAESQTYLSIYFAGIASLMVYNMGAAILRAVGDSKRPLFYLIISSFVNIVFDLIFVIVFKMGVAGAAYATVLSQVISSFMVLFSLTRTEGMFKLHWNKIKMHGYVMKEIFHIGLPTAIQQSITSFSNVFVQSYINAFGSSVMAAWSAYIKIDHFAIIPLDSISMSITTFVGQNFGVRDVKRAQKGTKYAVILAFAATAAITVPIMIFAPQFIWLFNKEAEVIEYGAFLLRFMTPFYSCVAVNHVLSGALCGSGDTKVTTAIRLFSFVIFRQIYLFAVTQYTDSFVAVALGYPLGWMISAVFGTIYYLYKKREIEIRFSA
ncbi:MAG: MATE family efflux transporter [Oscillospiraceae bacterium]|nr:MATE family efflux transporter [Oscillospiraceae bacterium]